jgi:hypothetical protein
MDDANLLGFTHGTPRRSAVEGFMQGIAEMLCRQGYEGCAGRNIDLPQLSGLISRVMTDHPAGELYRPSGMININIALTNAIETMHRLYSGQTSSLHIAIITDKRFEPAADGYQFCRASSSFMHPIRDNLLVENELVSPFYSTLFLSAPSIACVNDEQVYDRARVLGMHEQLHVYVEDHCSQDLCLMTSGEKDGLLGGPVSNDELDAKVAYLREYHTPYLCSTHDRDYYLAEHPLWVRPDRVEN